jgi:hypothetical protein
MFYAQRSQSSGLPQQGQLTSETQLIPRLRSTTGSMRTGKGSPVNVLSRLWNEESKDYEIKRAQIYMLQGFVISSYVLGVKTIITCLYQ